MGNRPQAMAALRDLTVAIMKMADNDNIASATRNATRTPAALRIIDDDQNKH
jgi:hypothetical protein